MMFCKFPDNTFSCNITATIHHNLNLRSKMRLSSHIPNDKAIFTIFVIDDNHTSDIGEVIVELKNRTIADIRLYDQKYRELNQTLLQRYQGYLVAASRDWF